MNNPIGATPQPQNLLICADQLPPYPTYLTKLFPDTHPTELIQFVTDVWLYQHLITAGEYFEQYRLLTVDEILEQAVHQTVGSLIPPQTPAGGYHPTETEVQRLSAHQWLLDTYQMYYRLWSDRLDQWLGFLKNEDRYAIFSSDVYYWDPNTLAVQLIYQDLYPSPGAQQLTSAQRFGAG